MGDGELDGERVRVAEMGDIRVAEIGHSLAADVDRFDASAGRAIREAVARAVAPMRVQIAGRAGVGRAAARRSLPPLPGAEVSVVTVDSPDLPEPVLDADVVVYVLPVRPDPVSVHPADRAALTAVDPRRIVAVVAAGATVLPELTALAMAPARTLDDPALPDAVAGCAAGARAARLDAFTRTVAQIPASPRARDVIEAVLDSVTGAVLDSVTGAVLDATQGPRP